MCDIRLQHVWLLSFGDSRLVKPRERLRNQARRFGFQDDHICLLNENDLADGFREEMREHMILGTRGFGYWCWKPEICLRMLERIPEGDVLFYLDIGCHLNKNGKDRFYDYVKVAIEHDFCAFQCRSLMGSVEPDPLHHYYTTAAFTKGDMLDYYGVRNDKRLLCSGQVLSGALFFRKCDETVKFCKAWKDIYYDDFSLIDDSPSKSPNAHEPCLNRHDQAALSIIWLQHGWPTVSACEIEPARRWAPAPMAFRHNTHWGPSYFFQMRRFPILAKRDKGLIAFPVKVYRHLKYYVFKPIIAKLKGR